MFFNFKADWEFSLEYNVWRSFISFFYAFYSEKTIMSEIKTFNENFIDKFATRPQVRSDLQEIGNFK